MEKFLVDLGLNAEMVPVVIGYAVNIIVVILILLGALIVSGIVQGWTEKGLKKAKMDLTLARFLSKAVRWAIMLLAGLACLERFGVDTTSFAAVIGGGTLAIGLAFQGSLSNVAAGVMLLVFRPFSVGDVVTVAGKTGGVESLGLFSTELNTPQNVHIIVPNGKIFGDVITNLTHNPFRRVDISVGVDYDADIEETRKVLTAAAKTVKSRVMSEESNIFLSGLGGSSVDWQVRVFSSNDNYWDVYQETIEAVKNHLDEAGIGIPYPNVVVHPAGEAQVVVAPTAG